METLKRNIAIVCGGDSSEHDVSIRSAQGIYSFFDKERYNVYLVVVKTGQDWHVNLPDGNTAKIDKNDFSFVHDGKAVVFDYAYITIHGTPGENGVMQGYFELLHIPYSTSGVLVEAMTFDKFVLNNYLRGWGISVAKSLLLRRGEEERYSEEFIEKEIGMPCFVKPAADGSSFGVSKVKNADQLAPALRVAFMESDEVMIEKYLKGTEISIGCYKAQEGAIVVLEDINFETPKTKAFVEMVNNLKISDKKVLLVTAEANKNVYLSARNLQRAKVAIASDINTYGVLNAGVMVVTEGALAQIETVLNK